MPAKATAAVANAPGSPGHPSPVWEQDYDSFTDFFSNMTADIGADSFRCDCHRNSSETNWFPTWYETYFYFNRKHNFNVTFTVVC